MNKYDLIVVGAGNLGTFHAYHALKMGKKVLLVERDSEPKEATVRNFGQIVPSGQSLKKWFDYGRKSIEIYQNIQSQTDISIRNNGSYYFASDDDELLLLVEAAYLFTERGYKVELLTAKQCISRTKGLNPNYVKGGLYFPNELSAEPRSLIHLLIKKLVHDFQLNYLNNNTIIHCEIKKQICEVTTSTGEQYSAEKVVICNGHDFKTLFPTLFTDSKMTICKLNMMQTHPQANYTLPGNILSGLSIRRYDSFKSCKSYKKINTPAWQEPYQRFGIHILFKQAIDGSVIIGDSHEYTAINQNADLDFGIDMEINELILSEAKRIINLPHYLIKNYWAGYYANPHDGEIFKHHIDHKIYIVTGIGGKGMTCSPGYAYKSINKIFEK
jgi:FAD dependent oxidoreductase TIGR03364